MRTNKIEGKFVNLRIAELEDAEFSLSCRQNKEKNTFIPSIQTTVEQQEKWIQKQLDSDDCYFFIVERKNGERIGTFSLYNIIGEVGESGRLVMLGNQLESLETGILFNKFCFNTAKMSLVKSEIDAENNAAMGYSNRLGGKSVGEYVDEVTGRKTILYHATKENFELALIKLERVLNHFDNR